MCVCVCVCVCVCGVYCLTHAFPLAALFTLTSPGTWYSTFLLMNSQIQEATQPKLGQSSLKASLPSLSGVACTGARAVLSWSKRLECFAKQDPGRARQSS